MNKFRANLHPAFFYENYNENGVEKPKTPDSVVEHARQQTAAILETNKNQNNEAFGSEVETKEQKNQTPAELEKELQKQLKQLAKNKGIDFPWTNNLWRCSRAEKRLAISSVKVFMQLIEKPEEKKVEKIFSEFRTFADMGKLELDDKNVADFQELYEINSKEKDIKNFYKSFIEYQSRQSGFLHLQGLMGFFFEKGGIDSRSKLQERISSRSVSIEKKEVKDKGKAYKEAGNKDWREHAKFDIIKERVGKMTDSISKMLFLLCDFNLDGEVNTGDVGYKTGSQFIEEFKIESELSKLQLEEKDNKKSTERNNKTPVENLVDFANKMGLNIKLKDKAKATPESLYEWMTGDNGYENTMALQNLIKNSPVDFSEILRRGEKAGEYTLKAMIEAEKKRAAIVQASKKAVEEKDNKKFTEQTAQGENNPETQTPEVQRVLDNKVKEILASEQKKIEALYPDKEQSSNIMQQLTNSLSMALLGKAIDIHNKGVAAGAAVPLDKIIKGLSASVNVGVNKKGKPVCGLFIGWDKSFDLGNGTELSLGATGGSTLFMPFGTALSAEISKDLNYGKRKENLTAMGIKKISLGGDIAIGKRLGWGVAVGIDTDKKKGVDKQSENIHNVVEKQVKSWIEALPRGEGATFKNRRDALKVKLAEDFGKTDKESKDLDTAADNLMRVLESYPINATSEDVNVYAKVVADVFVQMWKNNAVVDMTDNKLKITGGKLGVHFFAGFFPTFTAVAEFTRYRNARTLETENSMIRRIDAAVNGKGNKNVTLEKGKITDKEFNSMKGVLARYGVNEGFEFDEKKSRIKISPSVGNAVDVRVSGDLGKYVGKEVIDGKTYYTFPTNTIYRLFTETGGNQKSAILNIGGRMNQESDISITNTVAMDTLAIWNGTDQITEGKEFPNTATDTDRNKKAKSHTIEYTENSVNDLFTPKVKEAIKTIDANWKVFSEFMRNKKAANESFEKELETLKGILRENVALEPIYNALCGVEKSNVEKQLIMDRVLAISADADVKTKEKLDNLITRRKTVYEKLLGSNNQSIFDGFSDKNYRAEIQEEITDENCNSQIMGNILGATAFYNRNADRDARGLALTGLGVTSVLGGVTKELNKNDTEQAKKWFLGGEDVPGVLVGEKSPNERNNLKESVEKYIKKVGINIASLSDRQLKNLLAGKQEEFTLDNFKEKAKIKLETKYVFYLMGECANESVGIQLGNIQVVSQEPKLKSGEFIVNNLGGRNEVDNTQDRFAGGFSWGGGAKNNNQQQGSSSTRPRETEHDLNKTHPDGTNPTKPEENNGQKGGGDIDLGW